MLAGMDKKHAVAPGLYDESNRHMVVGVTHIAEKRYEDAIRELGQANGDDCTGCTLPYVALAHDLAGRPDSAIAVHERFLLDKTYYRMNIDAEHLSPTYKRLGELYEAKGDKAKAVGYYQKFAELWKNADAELQPQVRAVKDKLARLQKQGG